MKVYVEYETSEGTDRLWVKSLKKARILRAELPERMRANIIIKLGKHVVYNGARPLRSVLGTWLRANRPELLAYHSKRVKEKH